MDISDEFVQDGQYQTTAGPITVCTSRRELRIVQNRRATEPEPHTDIRIWWVSDSEAIPSRSGVRLSRAEARMLRDVLNSMNLGNS